MKKGKNSSQRVILVAKLFLLFVVWRAALFGLGFIAPSVLPYQPSFASPTALLIYKMPIWIYSWANFDGVHYLTLGRWGYNGAALIQAFFPLLPLLMATLNYFLQNLLVAGLLITNGAFFIALVGWFVMTKSLWNQKMAWIATAVLLLFPTSFYFVAIYNESIYLALIIWSWYFVRKRHWIFAGLLGGLAAATRVVGVLWLAVLLWEFLQLKPKERRTQLPQLAIALLLTMSGLVAFMLYLNQAFADPLLFLHVQSQFGAGRSQSLIIYPQVIWRYLKILATARPFDLKYFAYTQEFIAGTIGLVTLVVAWLKKLPKSLVIYSVLAFLLPTLTGTFSSMPRYLLSAPAIIVLPAVLLAKKPHWLWLYLLFSTILLVVNTILFIQGYWVA